MLKENATVRVLKISLTRSFHDIDIEEKNIHTSQILRLAAVTIRHALQSHKWNFLTTSSHTKNCRENRSPIRKKKFTWAHEPRNRFTLRTLDAPVGGGSLTTSCSDGHPRTSTRRVDMGLLSALSWGGAARGAGGEGEERAPALAPFVSPPASVRNSRRAGRRMRTRWQVPSL